MLNYSLKQRYEVGAVIDLGLQMGEGETEKSNNLAKSHMCSIEEEWAFLRSRKPR